MSVNLDREFSQRADLLPLIDHINAEQHRLPWMDDRLLVPSLAPDPNSRAGP